MAYSNDTVAENFLRQTGLKETGGTCRYHENRFWSYSTQYAQLDIENNVLLLADNSMTSTTSKHRCALVSNAIDNNVKIINVPARFGEYYFPTNDQFAKRYTDYLDSFTNIDFALADLRREYLNTLDLLKEFNNYAHLDIDFNTYNTIAHKLTNDVDFIKECQKQRRQTLKEQRSNSI